MLKLLHGFIRTVRNTITQFTKDLKDYFLPTKFIPETAESYPYSPRYQECKPDAPVAVEVVPVTVDPPVAVEEEPLVDETFVEEVTEEVVADIDPQPEPKKEKTVRIEVYQDKRSKWRWRLQANNQKVIAKSSEGYNHLKDLERSLEIVFEATQETSDVVYLKNAEE